MVQDGLAEALVFLGEQNLVVREMSGWVRIQSMADSAADLSSSYELVSAAAPLTLNSDCYWVLRNSSSDNDT